MRACLVLVLLAGCASTAPYTRAPRPCQAQALDLVWRGTYGRADRPPDVWWVPPADQTCGRVVHGARGFPSPIMVDGKLTNGCVGASAAGDNINLVWFGAWELTGLAHELAHVAQAHDKQPHDWAHTTAPFQSGGAVQRANASLAAMRCAPGEAR